jgi:hypothetical protein
MAHLVNEATENLLKSSSWNTASSILQRSRAINKQPLESMEGRDNSLPTQTFSGSVPLAMA